MNLLGFFSNLLGQSCFYVIFHIFPSHGPGGTDPRGHVVPPSYHWQFRGTRWHLERLEFQTHKSRNCCTATFGMARTHPWRERNWKFDWFNWRPGKESAEEGVFFGAKLAKFVICGVGIVFVEVSGFKHVSMDIGKSLKRQVILHCKAPVYFFFHRWIRIFNSNTRSQTIPDQRQQSHISPSLYRLE